MKTSEPRYAKLSPSYSLLRKSTSASRAINRTRRYIIESIMASAITERRVSTTAITISNVLRVQSRLRVPPVGGRGRDQPTMVFIAVNLVSLRHRALHRTRNLPPLISRLHLRRSFIYAGKCTDKWRGSSSRVRTRGCRKFFNLAVAVIIYRDPSITCPIGSRQTFFLHARMRACIIHRTTLSFVKTLPHVNKYICRDGRVAHC